jgi:hypothetical protein
LLTRHLTIELSPPVLRDEGLTQALVWLAAQIHEKQGLRIEIQADASFAMADEAIQVLLFNCVRELLFNIIKHAGVDRALVSLKRSNDNLVIEIRDEGKGFDVSAFGEGKKQGRRDSTKIRQFWPVYAPSPIKPGWRSDGYPIRTGKRYLCQHNDPLFLGTNLANTDSVELFIFAASIPVVYDTNQPFLLC